MIKTELWKQSYYGVLEISQPDISEFCSIKNIFTTKITQFFGIGNT